MCLQLKVHSEIRQKVISLDLRTTLIKDVEKNISKNEMLQDSML